jgi:hypothetical protein
MGFADIKGETVGEVIVVPFGLAYKEVASAVAKSGYDAVYNTLIDQGFDATVVTVIIRKALSRGWGS